MKVIGYIRVSTEEQATDGVSLATQREKLNGYAKLYDLELVEIIEDAGESGKTLNRPGLQRALAMIRRGQAGGLLIAKLDRLSRSVVDWNTLIDGYFGERCGKVRFGYRLADDGTTLIAIPEEQEAIQTIRRLKAAGESLRDIAAELTRRGILTKEGNAQWKHTTVARILERTA